MAFPWDLCGGSSTENDLRTTSRIAEEECHRGTHLSSPLPSSTSDGLSLSAPRPAREPLKFFECFLEQWLKVWVKVTGACLAAGTW